MENIKGWAIDLKTVYGRRWRDKLRFHASEDLWESEDGTVAGLLYGIAEVGISKEIGSLAVFRHKEKPVMAFNLLWLKCWNLYGSPLQFGKNEFLFVHRFISGGGRLRMILWVLDLAACRLAPIDRLPEDFHSVQHIGGTGYRFMNTAAAGSPGTVIDLKNLSWRRLPRFWWEWVLFQ